MAEPLRFHVTRTLALDRPALFQLGNAKILCFTLERARDANRGEGRELDEEFFKSLQGTSISQQNLSIEERHSQIAAARNEHEKFLRKFLSQSPESYVRTEFFLKIFLSSRFEYEVPLDKDEAEALKVLFNDQHLVTVGKGDLTVCVLNFLKRATSFSRRPVHVVNSPLLKAWKRRKK